MILPPIFSSPIVVGGQNGVDGRKKRGAAAGDDALFDRRAGGRERVLDAELLLFEFGLGGRANLDHRDTARELRQTLLELLTVVVGVGALDLRADLGDAALDRGGVARALDDGRVCPW